MTTVNNDVTEGKQELEPQELDMGLEQGQARPQSQQRCKRIWALKRDGWMDGQKVNQFPSKQRNGTVVPPCCGAFERKAFN